MFKRDKLFKSIWPKPRFFFFHLRKVIQFPSTGLADSLICNIIHLLWSSKSLSLVLRVVTLWPGVFTLNLREPTANPRETYLKVSPFFLVTVESLYCSKNPEKFVLCMCRYTSTLSSDPKGSFYLFYLILIANFSILSSEEIFNLDGLPGWRAYNRFIHISF